MTSPGKLFCSGGLIVRLFSCKRMLCLAFMLLFLPGCTATYPVNAPLAHVDVDQGYNIQTTDEKADNHSQALVLMAFSGGGTRAAAFSYGVLKELSETYIGDDDQKRALSKEIDVISAVSGGSFTAAYYGLFGDRIFEDYEQVFLRRDVQGELTDQVLNPLNWARLLSPYYTRADMATQLYDDTIFNHATFGDLAKSDGPFIIINATEMTLGLNWYLNSMVRMQFNWEHAWYHNPITLGTNAVYRQTDAALVRFQIIF